VVNRTTIHLNIWCITETEGVGRVKSSRLSPFTIHLNIWCITETYRNLKSKTIQSLFGEQNDNIYTYIQVHIAIYYDPMDYMYEN
jgi:hypothetical protein